MPSQGSLYGAAAPPSGSFVNLGAADAGKRGGVNFHAQSIGFLVTPPLLMYTFMDIIFAFLSGTHMPLAIASAAACIAFALLFASIGRSHVKGPIYMFVSILCFIATVNGIMSGLSIQARFYAPYWNYKIRPVYTDVMATEPAAARADGGIINFANNAIVDTFRNGNMLSTRGNRFCVAPILDESQQTRAEFWAVGMDCCRGHIGFYCDDVQDVSAKTGAVIFDQESWFSQDPYGEYQTAVKQASARNGLEIPERPVLVRWVKDPATVTDSLWSDGTMHLATGIFFYAFISVVIGMALHASSSMIK